MNEEPLIFDGGIFTDGRGHLYYNNNMLWGSVRRYYLIEHVCPNVIRAWHGHLQERKWFMVVSGTFQIGVVKLIKPELSEEYQLNRYSTKEFFLSDKESKILYVPGGYANGFQNLTSTGKLMIFSSATIEESRADDFRFNYDTVNIWEPKRY